MNFHTFMQPRPKVMVVSHERSGTHFLMNALAKSFGYQATPWINFDYNLGLNLFHGPTVIDFFRQFRALFIANIVKSHHPFMFFQDVIETIAEDFHIFYVYRDPRDVMTSYWRFLQHWEWHEGPKTSTASDFIRTQPSGWMMRYQHRQEKTMIHRWVTHVDSWTQGVPESVRHKVTLVRFRDLVWDYERLMDSFTPIFGEAPRSREQPPRDDNTIMPHHGQVGGHVSDFDDDDLDLFERIAGPTMTRLGFTRNVAMPPVSMPETAEFRSQPR